MSESVAEDMHNGLADKNPQDKLIIFSVGHRCSTASLIKMMNQKFESYPFDWIVSKLDVVVHSMETDFEDFLRIENYQEDSTETFNLFDGVKVHVCNENVVYNKMYESFEPDVYPTNHLGTYGKKLAMSHHDIRSDTDHQYFERCISRFKNILTLPQRKYYLYTHPIMGLDNYRNQTDFLQSYFGAFTEYMKTKTENSFGIYFIVVKNDDRKGEIDTLIENEYCIVYTLNTNKDLIDAGAVFSGDFYTEQHNMLVAIESIIEKTRTISTDKEREILY